jgi:phytanoyl-CoA hydroxylase
MQSTNQEADAMDLADYYEEKGYVVVENLLPESKVDRLLEALARFKRLKLPYYSQSIHDWIAPEIDAEGFMVESMECFTRLFLSAGLRRAGNDILLGREIQDALRQIRPGRRQFVQWQNMLFDRSTGTVDHVDSWYLDTEPKGDLVAAWVALEDINEGAGPFRVYPGSHRLTELIAMEDIDHETFRKRCAEVAQRMPPRPAMLAKGSVLFWHPWTLHGSANQSDPRHSRKSLTSHYYPRECLKKGFARDAGSLQERLRAQARTFRRIGDHPILVDHSVREAVGFNRRGLTRYAYNRLRGRHDVEMDMRSKSYGDS